MNRLNKRIFSMCVVLCMILSYVSGVSYAKAPETIVILYENDVHCAVEGYSKLAAMKTEISEEYEYVGVVSCGDYVQGGTLGAVSKGEYIINLMNLVGYDAVALGNHEFDYHLPRLNELVGLMKTKPVCSNFYKIGEDKSYFEPYSIVSYGDVDIAYIGIITPGTVASSNPAQFKDENGEFIYTFSEENLYDVVQKSIDEAESKGADVIIALSHTGYGEDSEFKDVSDVIENTDGLDVVLDAHSHSVIEGMTLKNKLGEDVLLTSTGTGFEHIGKLTINGDDIKSELIKTETYEKTDKTVNEYIKKINEEYATLGDRKIAESKVELITHDEGDNRLVRNNETNLGNLCADALYSASDVDVAYVNGGGIRAPMKAGDVTFNDIFAVFPFGNQIAVAEMKGSQVRDMLEMAVMNYPNEDGSFPHVAGITFSVDASVPTSVRVDENGVFTGVDGEYRVYDLKVFNKVSGEYEPLKLDSTYKLSAFDYFIVSQGGGMSMFAETKIVQKDGLLDVEALETYITKTLGGVIGEEYATVDNRITFTDGKNDDSLDAFSDLSKDAWYSEAANYVLENRLMKGVSENSFAPNRNVTRAMLVTVLYRAENEPATNRGIPFSDVDMDAYYANAVSWAKQNGIVNGVGENKLAPNANITREQVATIMHRYAKLKGYDVSVGENTNILSYNDFADVSEYSVGAMQYAVGSGLMKDKTESTLNPKDHATRIEIAAILYRFIKANS